MKAEIITIGDEILIGQTVDTNSAWIGSEMSKAGFDVQRRVSVHDRHEDIVNALRQVEGRSDVVLITGGLGPTRDDITKPALCEFFDTRLVTDREVLKMIEELLKRRGYPMNYNNRSQADIPESCTVLKNKMGTAPGMWFEKDGTIFVSMPGVPAEMKYIMNEHVLPALKSRFTTQVIIHRTIMTYGTFEAKLAETLTDFEAFLPENFKLAYLPCYGVIKLRLTATGKDAGSLALQVEEQVGKLRRIIPELIFSENEEPLEKVTGFLLREKNLTLSTAESCTGGRIAGLITSVPGSSDYFKGSVVAYHNSIKTGILGVPEEMIREKGAVSEESVISMAEGVRRLLGTDLAVATSGIAGPDGGTPEKPVGTVWIAVAAENRTVTEKHTLGRERQVNIERFSLAALNLLRRHIKSL
jgi:nicotinamide-nucleotide amidase